MNTTGTTDLVTVLPPGPQWPGALQALLYLAGRRRALEYIWRRYGSEFTVAVPLYGRVVVVTDPILARQLLAAGPDIAGKTDPNLGRVLGQGSLFNLDQEPHRRRRRLLSPPLHGKRMRVYEDVIEQEFRRESTTWPEGVEFAIQPSTMRITLNAILRAVFGAEGDELDRLREIMPPLVTLASRLAVTPRLPLGGSRFNPSVRFAALRREYDELITALIGRTLADPLLDERADILSLLLRSRYDDGEAMSHSDIADELLTLLAAGHETTATTLAWAAERLRRHPVILARLVEEIDSGAENFLQATIWEVQRVRPVIGGTGRQVRAATMELGPWVLPRDCRVLVGIGLMHLDEQTYPNARAFDPDRYQTCKPDFTVWLPYGGGYRRCIGAEFANMEMKVVLRCLLRDFELVPTTERDEKWHDRGVAFAPGKGGRVVLRRRPSARSRSAAEGRAAVGQVVP
ncbi:cytochrome P450 [Nocardia sp. NPDC004722]